jgi:hypothetical protein
LRAVCCFKEDIACVEQEERCIVLLEILNDCRPSGQTAQLAGLSATRLGFPVEVGRENSEKLIGSPRIGRLGLWGSGKENGGKKKYNYE